MKKIIIFGAGYYGTSAFYKLISYGEIVYYVDNNVNIQGSRIHDIPIISSEELEQIYDSGIYDIIICTKLYGTIANQLNNLGIYEYYVMLEGFLYYCDTYKKMFPVELNRYQYYKKENNEKNILFVQNAVCIRTYKIATVMKKNGYKTILIYTIAPPGSSAGNLESAFDCIYTFDTPSALIDFVENSEFDIIHSSNEPDLLTNLLLMTKKHIVFDTHDMMSLRKTESVEHMVLEYIANVNADGNIYTSDSTVDIAKKKFGLANKEIITWENIVLEQQRIIKKHRKLSSIDGEIHCVYEGGIVGNDRFSHRYFEDIWKKIADFGIHIHFYSQSDCNYCAELEKKSEYFHYEGNLSSDMLIQEMTKYDCGLLILNINEFNKAFLNVASPNKLYEYINACIPIAVGNITSLVELVEKYGVGKRLDMEGNIKEQILSISQMNIEDDFLTKKRLTMMAKSKELVDFYERVKKSNIVR